MKKIIVSCLLLISCCAALSTHGQTHEQIVPAAEMDVKLSIINLANTVYTSLNFNNTEEFIAYSLYFPAATLIAGALTTLMYQEWLKDYNLPLFKELLSLFVSFSIIRLAAQCPLHQSFSDLIKNAGRNILLDFQAMTLPYFIWQKIQELQ